MGRKTKDKLEKMVSMSVKVTQEIDAQLKSLKKKRKRLNISEIIRLAIEEYLGKLKD